MHVSKWTLSDTARAGSCFERVKHGFVNVGSDDYYWKESGAQLTRLGCNYVCCMCLSMLSNCVRVQPRTSAPVLSPAQPKRSQRPEPGIRRDTSSFVKYPEASGSIESEFGCE